MKKIRILIQLYLCLFVQFSYSQTVQQKNSPVGVYPLQVGNLWQYRDTYDTMYVAWTARAVRDTTLSNGHTYRVVHQDGGNDNLYRQQGEKVYRFIRYRTGDTTYLAVEELWYDFSKTTGDIIEVRYFPKDTVTVRVIDDRMLYVFGKLRRTWVFYETSKRTSVYIRRHVADSVGLIHQESEPGISYTLFGAIINGVKYGTITGVEDSSPLALSTYSVRQNYPNPFNPSTTIEFHIPYEKYVSLVVYNLLGERVRTLFSGKMSSGSHNIVWDGKNDAHANVSSGIFFYQIKTADFIETKKMLLLR